MELAAQIKQHRNRLGWSQEDREILAFMEGKPVDEIRSERQLKKELVLKLLAGAAAGLVLAILGSLLFSR